MIVAGRDKTRESTMRKLLPGERQGVSPPCVHTIFFLTAVVLSAADSESSAQSTSVDLPLASHSWSGEFSASTTIIAAERVPVVLSAAMQQMEAVLAVPQPEIDERPIKASELLVRLRELRLPVALDQSAIFDTLDESTDICLPMAESRLIDRLDAGLGEFNACLQLFPTHARIISKDVQDDPEYFITLTYDVSGISAGPDAMQLIGLVQQTVDNDAWSSIGNGDQMLIPYRMGRRQLLTISAPWTSHLKVRNLFSQLTSISGYPAGRADTAGMSGNRRSQDFAGISTAVALPESRGTQTRIERFAPISPEDVRGGGGFSGSGLGGGAFSVR